MNDNFKLFFSQVAVAAEGIYQVRLKSSVAPFIHTIVFEIDVLVKLTSQKKVESVPNTGTSDFKYLIIIAAGLAVFAMIMTITAIVLCGKIKKMKFSVTPAVKSKKQRKVTKGKK